MLSPVLQQLIKDGMVTAFLPNWHIAGRLMLRAYGGAFII